MVLDVMNYLYNNPNYLEYLRFHPKWYRVLDSNPNSFQDFINEANKDLHLTSRDKINDFSKKLSFFSSILKYLNKK